MLYDLSLNASAQLILKTAQVKKSRCAIIFVVQDLFRCRDGHYSHWSNNKASLSLRNKQRQTERSRMIQQVLSRLSSSSFELFLCLFTCFEDMYCGEVCRCSVVLLKDYDLNIDMSNL